jgi:predicted deacetylase
MEEDGMAARVAGHEQIAMNKLLVSIHDVGPAFEREVDALHALLARHIPEARLAMLVVPDHWGRAPLARGSGFARRLCEWSAAGIEMFVHGWFHRDTSEHHGFARFKARHMTASEGEFLGIDQATAATRMRDGKALIEDIIGRAATGFVAPAWLYGPGARAALGTSGFALAEDHFRVWQPQSGRMLATGPVVTWASRSAMRIRSSLAVAAAARAGLFRQQVLRLAVHPGDAGVPALVSSIDRTLARLVERRAVGRYADLLSDAG